MKYLHYAPSNRRVAGTVTGTWKLPPPILKYFRSESYVYWAVHHLDGWIKRNQLDVTCSIISLFTALHVSDINTPILRRLRLIGWVISCVVLFWFDVRWCYVVVWMGWCGVVSTLNQNNTTHEITHQIRRNLLRMDVLTSETCWGVNNEIIKQVTSSWYLFIQLSQY